MIGYDRIRGGSCPQCNKKMSKLPRDVIGKADKHNRWFYENYECVPCGLKFAILMKEPLPTGLA